MLLDPRIEILGPFPKSNRDIFEHNNVDEVGEFFAIASARFDCTAIQNDPRASSTVPGKIAPERRRDKRDRVERYLFNENLEIFELRKTLVEGAHRLGDEGIEAIARRREARKVGGDEVAAETAPVTIPPARPGVSCERHAISLRAPTRSVARERSGRKIEVVSARSCSKSSCSQPAVATLTFVYADSTAVIGPLSRESEPHSYDLCASHAASFTAPRGWTVVTAPAPLEPEDDVLALARALAGEPEVKASYEDAGDDEDEQASDSHVERRRRLTLVKDESHER